MTTFLWTDSAGGAAAVTAPDRAAALTAALVDIDQGVARYFTPDDRTVDVGRFGRVLGERDIVVQVGGLRIELDVVATGILRFWAGGNPELRRAVEAMPSTLRQRAAAARQEQAAREEAARRKARAATVLLGRTWSGE